MPSTFLRNRLWGRSAKCGRQLRRPNSAAPSKSMSNMSEDARVRSYLDTRRRHVPTEYCRRAVFWRVASNTMSRLVQDPKTLQVPRVLFRAPDRIKAEELLSGMRWITDLSSNALVPGTLTQDVHDLYQDDSATLHENRGRSGCLTFQVCGSMHLR